MKTPARYTGMLLLAVGIFLAGYLANRQSDPATSSASSVQAVSYNCPMHPQYISDHAGDCPMCGMRLEQAASGADGHSGSTNSDAELIRVSAAKQQLIGVRTDEVRQTSDSHVLRVPGRITVDDQRLHRIVAATDGWILDLGSNPAGRFVRNGQLLATYYTRDLLASEQLFLVSTAANNPGTKGDAGYGSIRTGTSLIPQYPIDTLRGLGMSDRQIEEIQENRTSSPNIKIYSPVTGFVLARNVSPGQRFEKGTEFYRIADISHVWVMTDIFEKDRQFIQPGSVATIRYQGREFKARMSDALPQFDPQSRTLKTRFELGNPGNLLLPDMFVDVELTFDTHASITVPAEAVIDSGRTRTVYVEKESGVFEPRMVETGWRLGDRVQITRGIEPGERIVTSGNFLIDSESRMRLPAGSGATAPKRKVKDVVCGMEIDPDSPNTLKAEHNGQTYHFCMPGCRTKFLSDPARYIAATPAEEKTAKDLVCGMEVDPGAPDTLKTQYEGEHYYFCCESCRKSFEDNPEKYVRRGMATPDMSTAHKAR